MSDTLQEIIERLERASGPDRRLDAEIWLLVNDPVHLPSAGNGNRDHSATCARKPNTSPAGCDCGAERWNHMAPWIRGFLYGGAKDDKTYPHRNAVGLYTASLDAALSLVDLSKFEYAVWGIEGSHKAHLLTRRADLVALSRPCATPALALCIASLKARSQGDTP